MTLAQLKGKAASSVRDATRRINLWEGSVRSGKTVASLIAWLIFIRHAPPGPLLMVGRTERTLKHNVIDVLVDWLGQTRCRYVAGTGELHLLGRKIYVVGASDEGAEKRIRGLSLIGAYVDEASLVPESFWKMLLSRLSLPGARLLATTNPDSPNHYLKRDFIDRARELDIAVLHFTLDDNPHLTEEYKRLLKLEYGGPGTLFYRRFIEGLWVLAEGAIYDMWSDAHLVSSLPRDEAVAQAWVGIDYGTVNPFVALLMLHVTDPFECLVIASEWRWDSIAKHRQLTDSEYSSELAEWLRSVGPGLIPGFDAGDPSASLRRLVVDPSATSFIGQLSRDRFRHVWKADNTVLDGIRDTSTLLARRKLFVHQSCDGLKREMPGYSWDPTKQQKGEDAPLKRDDHGPDDLRYLVRAARSVWRPWVAEALKDVA